MHLVSGIRNDFRKYSYNGESLNGKQLIKKLADEGKQKRCRKCEAKGMDIKMIKEYQSELKRIYEETVKNKEKSHITM